MARAKKLPQDLQSLARSYTGEMIRIVSNIARTKSNPPGSRVAAAALLIERGWGRAPQAVTVDADIKVTIRRMLDGDDAKVIDVAARAIEDDTETDDDDA